MVFYVIVCSLYGSYYQVPLPLIFRLIMLSFNPAIGLISIICEQNGSNFMANIFDYSNYFGTTHSPITTNVPMWVINNVVLILIIGLFLILSAFRIRKISKKG